MSNAEEGRAAFSAMIHCANEVCKNLQAIGAQQERVIALMEEKRRQDQLILETNRDLMKYLASLQSQMGVLATVIADAPVALPAVEPAYDPLGALGQQVFNGLVNGLSPGGRATPHR